MLVAPAEAVSIVNPAFLELLLDLFLNDLDDLRIDGSFFLFGDLLQCFVTILLYPLGRLGHASILMAYYHHINISRI